MPARTAGASGNGPPPPANSSVFGRLPISFEQNKGQVGTGRLFLARTAGYSLSLNRNGVEIGGKHSIHFGFVGASTSVRVMGSGKLPGSVNYFVGNAPSRWHVDIPTYRKVIYRHLYAGIDLAYEGAGTEIEATWTLAPGADPNRISMIVSGTSRLQLALDGGLTSSAPGSRFALSAPVAYQSFVGKRRHVPVRFHLGSGGHLSLRVGAYDRALPLVVDPTLTYATNLGGSSSDFAGGIAVDSRGNSYIAGSTSSPDFPVVRAVQPREPGTTDQEDAFVAKLNPAGTALLFSTYLGGNNDEDGAAIALGAGGAVYVTGFTRSTDFPRRHELKQQKGGCNSRRSSGGDAFVVKLGSHGDKLIYSTCLGGSGTDWGTGIAVNRAGAAFVTGSTRSDNFPTANPLQRHRAGSVDAFVAELAPGGGRLAFSTYLGGKGADEGSAIALDSAGSPYVVGSTDSLQFPRRSPLQHTLAGGTDAFVVKLDPSGRHIVYATYLGGSGADAALGVAVDQKGDAYVAGATESRIFPTSHAVQSQSGGATDAFVTELAPDGASVVYSTYLGGEGNDVATAIAVDSAGKAYITGSTASPNFPIERPLQPAYAGGYFYGDAFVAELAVDGRSLVYSTYLGGKGDDVGMAVAVGKAGDAYITGGTSSEDFLVTHNINGGRPARGNAFVIRIREDPLVVPSELRVSAIVVTGYS
jgi:hypothetical protein